MHTQPMNQEVARLHRAESLRMRRSNVVIERESHAAQKRRTLRVWASVLVRQLGLIDAAAPAPRAR